MPGLNAGEILYHGDFERLPVELMSFQTSIVFRSVFHHPIDSSHRLNMSDTTVRGIVHVVEETKTYGQKGFQKRLVVLEQDTGRFTNYIPVEFIRDNCASADDLNIGDDVEISYQLSGRKWQRDPNSEVKYFLTAEALSFKKLAEGGGAGAPDAESGSANDAFAESNYDEGDIPF